MKVERSRLRGPDGEIQLKTYNKLKDPEEFSEGLLQQVLAGMTGRRYEETLDSTAKKLP